MPSLPSEVDRLQASFDRGFPQPETMLRPPHNRETFELPTFRRKRSSRAVSMGLGRGAPLQLETLRAALLSQHGPGRAYTVSELAEAWWGTPEPGRVEELLEGTVVRTPAHHPQVAHSPGLPVLLAMPASAGERVRHRS